MISTDERPKIGSDILNNLRKGIKNGQAHFTSLLCRYPTPKTTRVPRTLAKSTQWTAWTPSLEELIDQASEFQPNTLILGISEDELPLTLDLTNAAPGALLLAGDRGCGKSVLISSALTSACLLNSTEQVVFYILARKTEIYEQFTVSKHCKGLVSFASSKCSALINELADVVEMRRRNRPENPCIILVIDDLPACLEVLSPQDFARLCWLIRHGPRSFVWSFATLSAEDALQVDPKLLSAFRTRMISHIHDDDQAAFLSQDVELDARWIEEGFQYYVRYGGNWLPFWLCVPENYLKAPEVVSIQNMPETGIEAEPSPTQEMKPVEELIIWNDRLTGAAPEPSLDKDAAGGAPNRGDDVAGERKMLLLQRVVGGDPLDGEADNVNESRNIEISISYQDATSQEMPLNEQHVPGQGKNPDSLNAFEERSSCDRNLPNPPIPTELISVGFSPDEGEELENESALDITSLIISKPGARMFEVIDSTISCRDKGSDTAESIGISHEADQVEDYEDSSPEFEYVDENEDYPITAGADPDEFNSVEHPGEDAFINPDPSIQRLDDSDQT